MTNIELIDHIFSILFDIALPIVVLWIGSNIKQWLPKEGQTHQTVTQMMEVLAAFLRAEAAAKAAAAKTEQK